MKIIAQDDTSLLDLLVTLCPDCSKSTLRGWVEKKRVVIGNRLIERANHIVKKGEEVTVLDRSKFLSYNIQVLFEDRDLVVVNKPEGLLSVATDFEKSLTTHCILKRATKHPVVHPVHRLDRETSGVMVFAYSEKAKNRLKEMFYHHTIGREYIAIVEGKITNPKGTWKSYLQEDPRYYVKSVSPDSEEARLAVTHYEVIHTTHRNSFLRINLETGRKNQIRVHCVEAGFPIVGDKKYGAKSDPLKRLALHAKTLSFTHPITNKLMTFTAEMPTSFLELFKNHPKIVTYTTVPSTAPIKGPTTGIQA